MMSSLLSRLPKCVLSWLANLSWRIHDEICEAEYEKALRGQPPVEPLPVVTTLHRGKGPKICVPVFTDDGVGSIERPARDTIIP